MKSIDLMQGYFALVDDADFQMVEQLSWHTVKHKNGRIYATTRIDGKTIYLHRHILGVRNPRLDVDHENHNGLDCRRENLRVCTRSQNMANARKYKPESASSKFKGVTWDKERERWMAKIMVDYKTINLGRFFSESEAAQAYDAAAKERFGTFANGNGTTEDG